MATSNAYKAKPQEGWVASRQLAAISMEGRSDVSSIIQAFTGSHVYVAEYLMDEVLVHQPEELTHFLMKTSSMERLSASLCDAISTYSNGQIILKQLAANNGNSGIISAYFLI